MSRIIPLCRRVASLRGLASAALAFALLGCDDSESFTAVDEGSLPIDDAAGVELTPAGGPAFAARFAGGIPFGTYKLPTKEFGSRFNGAHLIIHPKYLLKTLSAIRSRGGKVAVRLSYGDKHVKDASGRFSLSRWKAVVDRYKGINFDSYIKDGTIIGHYLIDEPQDPRNWNGRPISQATVEEMAKHSKSRWPGMATIVRSRPDWLAKGGRRYRHLDAAWAQYLASRWSNPKKFVDENVAKAKSANLALVVGLNLLRGSPSKGKMSPSQVKSYGSALLSNSYPCAFISWKYRSSQMTSSMKDAMSYLRRKAQSRSTKTCKGG